MAAKVSIAQTDWVGEGLVVDVHGWHLLQQEMAIAEIYETELVDLPKACEAYGQAAEWFQGEESSRWV